MKSNEVIHALSALAQETRLELYRLLVKRGPDGFTPSEISERLSVPAPTLSFHLKELQSAKLIRSEREGRNIRYRIEVEAMQGLIEFLSEKCCSLADTERDSDCKPPELAARRRA